MHVVLCNAPPSEAVELAKTVVKEGLAACVNLVGPVRSVYLWKGNLHDDDETTLVCKVAAPMLPAFRERLKELHSYEIPEIVVLAVDVAESDPDYVAWVRSTATNKGGP